MKTNWRTLFGKEIYRQLLEEKVSTVTQWLYAFYLSESEPELLDKYCRKVKEEE